MTKLLDPPKAKPKEPTHDPGPAPANSWLAEPDVMPEIDTSKSVRQLLIEEAARGETEIVPLPVRWYEELAKAGWEDKSVELLDGLLIRKIRGGDEDEMGHGSRHFTAVSLFSHVLGPLAAQHGGHVRTQGPNRQPHGSEPEPDGMIVRGAIRDYCDQNPTPADCPCVVEVADTSLRRDRTHKLQLYAAAGIPQYVIENLNRDTLEVYEQPSGGTYARRTVVGRGGSVAFLMPDGSRVSVAADDLLP